MANPQWKGPLLRPSERGKAPAGGARPSTAPAARSRAAVVVKQKPQERFEVLKETIKTWLKDRFRVADALREIRDDKLYKKEYATFEQCCEEEFGLSRTYAYGLIDASDVKASLPQMSSIQDIVTNVSQARALAPVRETKRVAVLNRVSKAGPVTARAITEATKPRERKSARPIVIDVDPEPTKPEVAAAEPAKDIRFYQGVVWACARLIEMFDEPTVALEVLRESGAGSDELKQCTEYDLSFLRRFKPDTPRGVE